MLKMLSPAEVQKNLTNFPDESSDNDLFRRTFAEAKAVSGMSVGELAKAFQVSLPTIDRWENGVTAPHPVVRKKILNAFSDMLNARHTNPAGTR